MQLVDQEGLTPVKELHCQVGLHTNVVWLDVPVDNALQQQVSRSTGDVQGGYTLLAAALEGRAHAPLFVLRVCTCCPASEHKCNMPGVNVYLQSGAHRVLQNTGMHLQEPCHPCTAVQETGILMAPCSDAMDEGMRCIAVAKGGSMRCTPARLCWAACAGCLYGALDSCRICLSKPFDQP